MQSNRHGHIEVAEKGTPVVSINFETLHDNAAMAVNFLRDGARNVQMFLQGNESSNLQMARSIEEKCKTLQLPTEQLIVDTAKLASGLLVLERLKRGIGLTYPLSVFCCG